MKKKRRFNFITFAFFALLLLVVLFLVRVAVHRPPAVTLPPTAEAESGKGPSSDAPVEAIRRVEVTPDTVQRVIERLVRPESYRRTVTIVRYWGESSGESVVETAVSGDWTRLDETRDDLTRHVITCAGADSWVWYGDSRRVYSGAAALTADEEQSIPTYEDVLLLAPASIAAADYRALEGVNCIYVETAPDGGGYAARYWISVDTGLLVSAERLQNGTLVYSMRGLSVDETEPDAAAFTLPGGEILYDPNDESEG